MNSLSNLSLQRYLRDRLIILGVLLTLIYGYAMSSLYSSGLDDASEFYLYQDAEMAEGLIEQGQPLPINTLNRKLFVGVDSLPDKYRQIVGSSIAQSGISHSESDHFFDYILSYPLRKKSSNEAATMLFVIHTFDLNEDESVPGLSAFEVTLIGGIIALVFILLTSSLIYRSISRSVNTLFHWANNAEKNDVSVIENKLPWEALRFGELQAVGTKLYDAFSRIIASTEREKSFIRCLSHELRTPMAVTSAALDILDKKELKDDVMPKIKKLREANQKMISLSDTLLELWQDKEGSDDVSEINVYELVEEVIQENRYLAANPNINIEINITPSLVIKLPTEPFSIVLVNLIKNALQYTHTGFINIEITKERLVVTNSCDSNNTNQQVAHSDYGFCLGLFIAETVAKRQSWELNCAQRGDVFRSELVFE